jgi:hypothetical protein
MSFCGFAGSEGPSIDNNEPIPSPFTSTSLPQLADAASIQSAISEVCEMMLHRRIEPKEASSPVLRHAGRILEFGPQKSKGKYRDATRNDSGM